MCQLLEKARQKQGNISYYEVAKRIGISTPLMNKWKNNKSKPNGVHTLELAIMADVTKEEALQLMRNGFANLSLLIVTALSAIALHKPILQALYCILCKIEFIKMFKKVRKTLTRINVTWY